MSVLIPVAEPVARPTAHAQAGIGHRDLRIDLLRGLCVMVVIIDHVAGASPLYLLTGGALFFTSAAEGFILVSGLTAGMVYRRLMTRDGLVPSMTKALNRAFLLYLLTVGLTLILVPVSEALRLPWALGLDLSRSLKFVISVLTLHRTYPYIDVLLLYTLLFLTLPLVLFLIERGQAWVALLVSWSVWVIYQVYPEPATFPWEIARGQLFPFSAWQALFFAAFFASYYRPRLPALTPARQSRLLLLSGLAFAGLILLFALVRLPGVPFGLVAAVNRLFDRPGLGPGRLFASATVFGFLLLALTRWLGPLSRALGTFLLPFGQHALYAWTAHILVIIAIGVLMRGVGLSDDSPWLNAALQIAAVATVWLVTKRQFFAVTPQNRRYWYAAPAALAAATVLILQLPRFSVAH